LNISGRRPLEQRHSHGCSQILTVRRTRCRLGTTRLMRGGPGGKGHKTRWCRRAERRPPDRVEAPAQSARSKHHRGDAQGHTSMVRMLRRWDGAGRRPGYKLVEHGIPASWRQPEQQRRPFRADKFRHDAGNRQRQDCRQPTRYVVAFKTRRGGSWGRAVTTQWRSGSDPPLTTVRKSTSTKMGQNILVSCANAAMRRPISRVRSATETDDVTICPSRQGQESPIPSPRKYHGSEALVHELRFSMGVPVRLPTISSWDRTRGGGQ